VFALLRRWFFKLSTPILTFPCKGEGTQKPENRISKKRQRGPLGPLAHFVYSFNQMRIGITTYLKSALSGTVINADELASPSAMLTLSHFRLFNTSSK
jgi:hypothetical protein